MRSREYLALPRGRGHAVTGNTTVSSRRERPGMSRLPHPVPAPATDARLLTIAAEHLRRLGPRRVTVVGIAQAAGMTHANVYRYFPSKTALIDAVAAQWLRRLELGLAEIADAPDPADDKLERLLVAIAQGNRDCSPATATCSRSTRRRPRPPGASCASTAPGSGSSRSGSSTRASRQALSGRATAIAP
jgi:AcrR family transcriptional regulator